MSWEKFKSSDVMSILNHGHEHGADAMKPEHYPCLLESTPMAGIDAYGISSDRGLPLGRDTEALRSLLG